MKYDKNGLFEKCLLGQVTWLRLWQWLSALESHWRELLCELQAAWKAVWRCYETEGGVGATDGRPCSFTAQAGSRQNLQADKDSLSWWLKDCGGRLPKPRSSVAPLGRCNTVKTCLASWVCQEALRGTGQVQRISVKSLSYLTTWETFLYWNEHKHSAEQNTPVTWRSRGDFREMFQLLQPLQ